MINLLFFPMFLALCPICIEAIKEAWQEGGWDLLVIPAFTIPIFISITGMLLLICKIMEWICC